jgi:hypothetical protein
MHTTHLGNADSAHARLPHPCLCHIHVRTAEHVQLWNGGSPGLTVRVCQRVQVYDILIRARELLQPQRDVSCHTGGNPPAVAARAPGRGRRCTDAKPQQAQFHGRRSGGRDERAPHMTVELLRMCARHGLEQGRSCRDRARALYSPHAQH